MKINFTKFYESLSISLDYVEREVLNIMPYHGSRVAALSYLLGQASGFTEDECFALLQAGFFHDCALNEYLKDDFQEHRGSLNDAEMKLHCLSGEIILSKLPFHHFIKKTVLYHHECADGSGAFGKTFDEIPLSARILHMADALDVKWNLYEMDADKFEQICEWVKSLDGTVFDSFCADLFSQNVTLDFLLSISGEAVGETVSDMTSQDIQDISPSSLVAISNIFAYITDYKSHFTCAHSKGIAEKAERMGQFYGYDKDTCDKLHVAGALHDIGKLMISNRILEKPGKLSQEEFLQMQEHAAATHALLDSIEGMEDIASWASNHHEKLDGSGYPYGKTASELGKNERLMACVDIYQALIEDRPYKEGFSHERSMEILRSLGDSGKIDAEIVEDIDRCFSPDKV